MKLATMLGERFKKAPADTIVESQALMTRGGYMKSLGTGIFSLYTPAKKIALKIENILREEMDRIGGQEVLFPVAMPASIWKESGRYDSIGSELLRFKDRNDTDMVLGMTHEEAAVHLARDAAQTYARYPFMIYQIQTKFRDEARPKGGLLRVREFTMKDAYSFHTSQEDLESYYKECHRAYERIYERCGVPDVISVKSDSGMMGGRVSHEFMLLTDIGEDTLVICPECGYRSNMEAADFIPDAVACEIEPLTEVFTPDQKSIEEVCDFLKTSQEQACKAVVYQRNADDSYVIAFIRGDLEVNETKLRNAIKAEIHPAEITEDSGICAGFIGPIGLDKKITVVFDESLKEINSLVCGANRENYHLKGFNIARDLGNVEFISIAKAVDGGICPTCGKPVLTVKRGIEVGNIFQLGTKYTESMGMQYLDSDGTQKYPIMGCYGIGVGRLIASVCQASRDDYGPIWPMSIAPWQVHICALRSDNPDVKATADKIYNDLLKAGVEVIYDDRNVSAGVMFSDADLLGVPLRLVISPKTLERGCVEFASRTKSFREDLSLDCVTESVRAKIEELLKALMPND